MMEVTRRAFLGAAAAALPLSAAKFTKPIGVQLYTVRNVYPKEARKTIEAIAQIGYKEVETLRPTLETALPLLKEFGLKPVSGHYETPFVTGNWEAWKGAFPQGKPDNLDWTKLCETAAKAGQKFMVIPYVQPGERGKTLDSYKKFAEQLNVAGKATKAAGMQMAYHHHAFEFGELEGKRIIDVLLENTDPKLMQLEMDVFWVSIAGEDPVKMLNKWKGRVALMHLKDKDAAAPKMFGEGVPASAFKEVGYGTLDFKSILKTAQKTGVKHYFVEQDQTAGNPLDSLRKSFEKLKGMDV